MSRDAQIPIVLWITAAIVAHLAGGGGAVQVAQVALDRADLRDFGRAVREGVHPPDTTIELLMDGTPATPPGQEVAPPDDALPTKENAEPDPEAPRPEPEKTKPPVVTPRPKDAPAPPPPVTAAPPPPAPVAPPPPRPETPPAHPVDAKPVPAVPVPPPPPAPPPPPPDHRLAVRQHADKDEPDNPEAARIADEAHHTKEETVAKIRSHDQDAADPTPGAAAHPGPKGEAGNDDHTKVDSSEEHKGNAEHAPGEGKKDSTSAEHSNPAPPAPRIAGAPGHAPTTPGGRDLPSGKPAPSPSPPAGPPPNPGGQGPASPEVTDGSKGSYALDPANPGGNGKSRIAGRRRQAAPYQAPVRVGDLGLGGAGLPGVKNLDLKGVEQAVGEEKLKAEREGDGRARLSAHRGSWETNKFGRWRAAIENYEPSVQLGNQTSLNAARVPFATYINTIHNRLHPIFAEEFLASLENLPKGHSLNQDLVTHLEIVLSKDQGRIVRMGVTRASGVTAFDVVALNSVSRAQPFGRAPDAIVSPDGNVYLHWEFHRDPFDACTTRNARPFLLREAPKLRNAQPGGRPKQGGPTPGDDQPGAAPLLPLREP